MKPTLAIYGDSYASLMPEFLQPYTNNLYVWYQDSILTTNYEITNYGMPGIDFMYCYQKFIKTQHLYDNIVFIVTAATRLGFRYKSHYFNFSQIQDVQDRLELVRSLDSSDNELHNAVKSVEYFFKYFLNVTQVDAAQMKLVEEIKKCRPDAKVIFAFENQFNEESKIFNLSRLSNFKEVELFAIDDFMAKHYEMRNSHLSISNNKIFADYIFNRLNGSNSQLNYDMFNTIPPEDKYLFFIEKSKVEGFNL